MERAAADNAAKTQRKGYHVGEGGPFIPQGVQRFFIRERVTRAIREDDCDLRDGQRGRKTRARWRPKTEGANRRIKMSARIAASLSDPRVAPMIM